jgi:glycine cleavage system H protein
VSDLFAPLSGEVLESNAALGSQPELVNQEPFKGGWMIRLRVADPKQVEELLEPAAYDALVAAG